MKVLMVVLSGCVLPIASSSKTTQTNIGGFVADLRVRGAAVEVARCDVTADVQHTLTTWWTPDPAKRPGGLTDTMVTRGENITIDQGGCRARVVALPPGIEPPAADPPWCTPALEHWREVHESVANEGPYNRWQVCAERRREISVSAGAIADPDQRAKLLVTMPDCGARPPAPAVHATREDVARLYGELTPSCQRFAVVP